MGRRLGQHFLSNPAILDRIVEALEPRPNDVVIEIGPGWGTLTRRLAPRVGRVVAIERDRVLAAALSGSVSREAIDVKRETMGPLPPQVTVVAADALEADWGLLVSAHASQVSRFTVHGFKVIGNIPYYITTPLIEKALSPPLPRLVVFLVQKEVAERLAAQPGSKTFGALSAGVQALATVERLWVVRKGAFQPPPKVDSAVVRLRPLDRPLIGMEEQGAWRRFLASLFSQRRKQLTRSLRAMTGWDRDRVDGLLRGLALESACRPEMLSPQELVGIFRALAR